MDEERLHRIQQAIKWTVYALLILNWFYYIYEDWDRAMHTLTPESPFLDWASEFATSIDESAWFILLAMFELETYWLEDEQWTGWVTKTIRGVRIVCYIMILHTVYAFGVDMIGYQTLDPVAGVTDLCDMVDDDVSFVRDLEYTEVNAETCGSLSTASQFYRVLGDPVVTDRAGLDLEEDLGWADFIEVVVWLLILGAIELTVRLQGRGITDSPLISFANTAKMAMYLLLLGIGVYWATLSHWIYLWDEIVWIGGFAIIDMNVRDWRGEILEQMEAA